MVPAIRYPLPTMIAVACAGLLLWKGEEWSRPARRALTTRIQKAVAGPDVPRSANPQVVAGSIRRRVLILRDGVEARDKPGGRVVQTIRRRMFADVYDVWPLGSGQPPTHYRVGNGRAVGWIAAADALEWSTRLVVRAPEIAPVVGWESDRIRIATWDSGHAWSVVASESTIPRPSPTADAWGVFLSRQEVLDLLGATVREPGEAVRGEVLRARALVGSLGDGSTWSDEQARAALAFLGFEAAPSAKSPAEKAETLSRINENWTPDASWSGLSFRVIPLPLLP